MAQGAGERPGREGRKAVDGRILECLQVPSFTKLESLKAVNIQNAVQKAKARDLQSQSNTSVVGRV